jgi:hypothetical protein
MKSLHSNFELGLLKYLQKSEADMSKFKYVSFNASNMFVQLLKIVKPSADTDFEEYTESLGTLDGYILIVDEAHNFFNSIVNGSKNARLLYDMIMASKDVKLVFLTGTPIINDPFELVPCFNMLNPHNPILYPKPEGYDILPTDYTTFNKFYIKTSEDGAKSLINKNKFQNRLTGLLSYYGTKYTPPPSGKSSKTVKRENFPDVLPLIVEEVPMSLYQFQLYINARVQEIEEYKRSFMKGPSMPLQKPGSSNSTYRVKTRKLSNFAITIQNTETGLVESEIIDQGKHDKPKNKLKNKKLKNEQEKNKHDKSNNTSNPTNKLKNKLKKKGKGESELDQADPVSTEPNELTDPAELTDPVSTEPNELTDPAELTDPVSTEPVASRKQEIQISEETLKDMINKLEIYSPKMEKLFNNLNDTMHQGLSIIYSNFVTTEGIGIFTKILEMRGWIKWVPKLNNPEHKPVFAVLSGKVSAEERAEIISVFNSMENQLAFTKSSKHIPYLINTILVSSVGVEGLDLKGIQYAHMMEPYFHDNRRIQFIARAARYNSHKHLPKERQVVQPYIYLSTYPTTNAKEITEMLKSMKIAEPTTDVDMFNKALLNKKLNDQFLIAMIEVSIDCKTHNKNPSIKCRTCSPNNKAIFHKDFYIDLNEPEACTTYSEESVDVKEIMIVDSSGKQKSYFYSSSKDDITIFTYDDSLSGYIEIDNSDPNYYDLINQIKQKQKTK